MSTAKQKYYHWYITALHWAIGAVLIIAPFYAPLSVWLASSLEHFDLMKIWKEVALTAMVLIIAGFLFTHRLFARHLFKNRLLSLISLYICLVAAIGLYDLLSGRVDEDAVIYGLLVDIRPVGFFAATLLTFAIGTKQELVNFPWLRIILIPAAVVAVFGVLQMTALPKDVLTHIGYGENTITPYGTIDNQPDLVRIQATLRGPNPLGAYLLVVISLIVAMIGKFRARQKLLLWGLLVASLIAMFGSYSRSAGLGLVLAAATLLMIQKRQFLQKHLLMAGIVLLATLGVGAFALSQQNYFAQNVILHSSSESESSLSSNEERLAAMERGLTDIVNNPEGGGVGSAGPASLRNDFGEPKISENYFLQIGQELGIVGMLAFIAINVLVAIELWRRRSEALARALLASLVGISFINLLSHAWTDDTLAYIWWGLAGIALAPTILIPKSKQHKQEQKA